MKISKALINTEFRFILQKHLHFTISQLIVKFADWKNHFENESE